MPNQYTGGDKLYDISAIDARLTELEREKHQLIALREKLQKSRPTPPVSGSFSPEQKKAMGYTIFFSGESASTDKAKQFEAVLV